MKRKRNLCNNRCKILKIFWIWCPDSSENELGLDLKKY